MHAGNWGSISGTLAGCGTRTLAVFLTDVTSAACATGADADGGAAGAGAPESPFSMEQFALAMLRVGSRTDHVGVNFTPRIAFSLFLAFLAASIHLLCGLLYTCVKQPVSPDTRMGRDGGNSQTTSEDGRLIRSLEVSCARKTPTAGACRDFSQLEGRVSEACRPERLLGTRARPLHRVHCTHNYLASPG